MLEYNPIVEGIPIEGVWSLYLHKFGSKIALTAKDNYETLIFLRLITIQLLWMPYLAPEHGLNTTPISILLLLSSRAPDVDLGSSLTQLTKSFLNLPVDSLPQPPPVSPGPFSHSLDLAYSCCLHGGKVYTFRGRGRGRSATVVLNLNERCAMPYL